MLGRPARLGLVLWIFSALALTAQTDRSVPANYPTIQAAINAAADGDTVWVAPGTYFENINFNNKAIAVRSTNGAAVTTIDGQNNGAVVRMSSGNPSAAMTLDGFTITHGHGVPSPAFPPSFPAPAVNGEAGGVSMLAVSGTVIRCIIENNVGGEARAGAGLARGGAGGVELSRSGRLIECIVRFNVGGAGQNVPAGPSYIPLTGGRGGPGGVLTGPDAMQPLIMGCTIEHNTGGAGGTSGQAPNYPYFDAGPGGAYLQSNVQNVVIVLNTKFIENVGGDGGTVPMPNTGVSPNVLLSPTSSGAGALWINRAYCFGVLVANNVGGLLHPTASAALPVGGVAAANTTFDQCTIVNNQAVVAVGGAAGVGGIYAAAETTFTNGIIDGNLDGLLALSSFVSDGTGAWTIANSICRGGAVGTNVWDVDPLFTNPATDDFTLSSSSPAIDARPLPTSPFDLTAHDLAGAPRWLGTAPDWGAFEYGAFDAAKIGTDEDFALFVRRVGVGSPTALDKTIGAGLTLGVIPLSQGGTMSDRYPLLLADVFPEGAPPIPLTPAFPMIHIGSNAIVAFDGPTLGQTMNPPPFITFQVPPGLSGLVVRFQCAIYEPRARNGFFAMTDAIDVHFD